MRVILSDFMDSSIIVCEVGIAVAMEDLMGTGFISPVNTGMCITHISGKESWVLYNMTFLDASRYVKELAEKGVIDLTGRCFMSKDDFLDNFRSLCIEYNKALEEEKF